MDYYTQNNKSGDNIMNFGSQPRQLDDNLKSQLLKLLPNECKIDVTSVMGDGEAFNFAHQITEFLSGNNYEVEGVSQAIFTGPKKDKSWNLLKTKVTLIELLSVTNSSV